VKAGEQTGTLSKALRDLADELERKNSFRKHLRAALSYPLLLASGVGLLVITLALWVLPMYESLYASMEAELPFLTRTIFAAGRLLPWLGLAIAGFSLGSLIVLQRKYPRTWRLELTRWLGIFPLIGALRQHSHLVEFADVLARLLKAGIPLLEALRLTRDMMQGAEIKSLTDQLICGVEQGKHISPILLDSAIFPPDACDMIGVAEETGGLAEMFQYVALVFQNDLEEYLERMVKMLEPGLIIILAGIIGLVAVGVLIPIFDAGTYVQ